MPEQMNSTTSNGHAAGEKPWALDTTATEDKEKNGRPDSPLEAYRTIMTETLPVINP